MKMRFIAALSAFLIFTLTGCSSHDNNESPVFVTTILSDAAFDGDIQLNFLSRALSIAQGNTQSVFAGIDPIYGDEYRAFLDFLWTVRTASRETQSSNRRSSIYSSTISIFNFRLSTIPLRIDLVSFQPPFLFESDFDLSASPHLARRFSWQIRADTSRLM